MKEKQKKQRRLATMVSEPKEIAKLMANGNEKTKIFLVEYMKKSEENKLWIDVLDTYEIYGEDILILYETCCSSDQDLFSTILLYIDNQSFGTFLEQRKMLKQMIKDKEVLAS